MSAVTTTEKNPPTLTLANPLLEGANIDPTTAGLLAAEQFRDADRQVVRGYQVVLQPGYFLGVSDVRIEADTIRIPANFSAKIPSGTITLLARNIIAEGLVTLDVSGETHDSKPAATAATTVAVPSAPSAVTLPFASSTINIAMPASPPASTTAAAENRAANGSSATAGGSVKNGSDGANGTHGKHGGHGGSITVAAETLEGSSATAHFTLLARGGTGGDGQAGGHGGNGRHGNNGTDSDGDAPGGAGEVGGDGGKGGKGGDAGNGGNGGQIAFLTVKPFRKGVTTVDNAPGKAGKAGDGGKGGQAGQGGYGGLSNKHRTAQNPDPVFASTRYPERARTVPRPYKNQRDRTFGAKPGNYIRLMPDGEWGLDGSAGAAGKAATDGNKADAPRGNDGVGGDSYQSFTGEVRPTPPAIIEHKPVEIIPRFDVRKPHQALQDRIQRLRNTEIVKEEPKFNVVAWRENVRFNAALSLEYRLLLLRNVKMLYLQRTDDSLRAAATVLIWLASIHPADSFFADLETQGAKGGWTDDEIAFRNRVLTQRARFDMVRDQIGLLLQQLASGLDYFGNTRDWVPALPLKSYQKYSQSLVSAARGAETLFAQYLTASANASQQGIRAEDLQKAIDARLKALETERTDLLADRKAALDTANASYAQLDALEATLIRDGEAFVQALRSGLQAENVGAVFSIIKSVAVSAVGFGTVGSALKAGGAMRVAASTAVDKLLGDKKPKPISRDEMLIGKLEETHQTVTLDKAVRAASSLMSEIPNIIEKIGVLSDNTKRIGSASNDFSVSDRILKMDREAFKEMLMKVGDTVSAAKKEQYWKSFNQYLDRVDAYATAYARYAGAFLTETRLLTEREELQKGLLAVKKEQGDSALISHPDYLEALSNLLFNTKVALQDFLYQAGLAYRYWALKEPPAMPGLLGNVAEADGYAATLTEMLAKQLNQKQQVGQSFRLALTLTEKDFSDQFEALRQNKSALFVLDETVPAIAAEMALKANIRVSEIDIHLPGAFPSGGRAGISFIHTGASNFIRSDGERWHFSHIPTDGIYEYESSIQPAAGHTAPVGRQFIYKADPAPNHYGAAGRLLGYGAEQVERIEWKSGGTVSDQKTRILPALLGGWRLQLPAKGHSGYVVNDKLNPSRLTSIIIIFQGTAEAYRRQR